MIFRRSSEKRWYQKKDPCFSASSLVTLEIEKKWGIFSKNCHINLWKGFRKQEVLCSFLHTRETIGNLYEPSKYGFARGHLSVYLHLSAFVERDIPEYSTRLHCIFYFNLKARETPRNVIFMRFTAVKGDRGLNFKNEYYMWNIRCKRGQGVKF